MTNANNAARTSSNGARTEWPQRFGKLKSLQVKSGRTGSYGIITLDCGGKFEQTAFIFKAEALAKAEEAAKKANAAGVTADIWMKGPMEPVERDGVTRDQMKIVYLKDNTDYEAAAAEGQSDEGQSDEGQSDEGQSDEGQAGETAEGQSDEAPVADEQVSEGEPSEATASTETEQNLDDEVPF